MRRGLLRTLTRLVAITIALVGLALALLIGRLWYGPLSLDFLTARIVDGLEPDDGSYHLSVGATELIWAGGWRGIDLTVREVAFTDAAGTTIAKLPKASITLSVPALILHREIAPSRIELMGPDLRLVREPDGSIGFGLGRDTAETGGSSIVDSFDGVGASSKEAPAAMWLRRIIVRDGQLGLVDRQGGFETSAASLEADLRRNPTSFTIDLAANLALGPGGIPFRAHAERSEPTAPTQVALSVSDLDLPAVSSAAAPLIATAGPEAPSIADAASRLAVPLDVDVDLTLSEMTLRSVRVRATGEKGTLGALPLLPDPVPLEHLTLDTSFDFTAERAILDLKLDLGTPELRVAGTWERAGGALAVDLGLTRFPVSSLGGYWPAEAATKARTWIVGNITTGEVPEVSASLRGNLVAASPPDFTLERIDGRIDFAGLSVRYVDTMPPATDVTGTATFSADGWNFVVRSAKVAGLTVPGATVDITGLEAPVSRIKIDAKTSGPLRDALLLVDYEPLRYARRIGIDPSGATGAIAGRLVLDFPLSGAPVPSDLGAIVEVKLERAALPKGISDYSIADGDLKLDVRASKLALAGRVKIAGAPSEVAWREDLGATSGVARTVDVQSSVDDASRAALGLDLRPWLTGPVDVKAHLEQRGNGAGSADVNVDLTPAAVVVSELRLNKAPGAPGQASGTLTVADERIAAIEAFRFAAGGAHAEGRATIDKGRFGAIDLHGELAPAAPGGDKPDFTLAVTPQGTDSQVVLTSEDASTLLKLLVPDATTAGGQLRFTGRSSPAPAGVDLAGSLSVESFTLTESSVLARLATLASLPGIVSALKDEGIAFEKLTSDLKYAGGSANIESAVLTGPSLRLLFNGTIDGARDRVAIDGTLVPPVYGLNALPGKIPLIGGLFKNDGGGLFGIDFTVHGKLTDPKMSVKPLSSLTPRVLKSLGKPSDE